MKSQQRPWEKVGCDLFWLWGQSLFGLCGLLLWLFRARQNLWQERQGGNLQAEVSVCSTWDTGSSPSQRLFGRRSRTLLPTSSRLLVPETVQGVPHKLKERKAKHTYYYNRGAKELSKLERGVVVRVKPDRDSKTWAKATVDKEVDIRSYQVRTEDGRTYRMNRRHLRLTKQPFFRSTPPESPSQQHPSFTGADFPSCPVPISANMEVSDGPTVIQSERKPSNEPVSRSNDAGSVPVSANCRLRLLWRPPEAAEWFASH